MPNRFAVVITLLFLAAPVMGDSVVIRNVSVIDIEGERLLRKQTVVLTDGLIRAVGPAVTGADADRVIDGSGKFLMPSLWDMHAHYDSKRDTTTRMPLLSYGVHFRHTE